MLDFIKKELVSLVKWMLVISFAAAAYYSVSPKYVPLDYKPIEKEYYRLNTVTGVLYKPPIEMRPIWSRKQQEYVRVKEWMNGFWTVEQNYNESDLKVIEKKDL